MRKGVLVFFLAIALGALALWSVPPVLLPQPLYQALYGWRFPSSRVVGDATLTDSGPAAAHERFVVDIGTVDVLSSQRTSYSLRDLPEVELTIGFMVHSLDPQLGLGDQKPLTATLGLQLLDSQGRLVVDEVAPAGQWVWTGSRAEDRSWFLYRRGRHEEKPLGGGTVTLKRMDVKASRGWGTYFTPRSSQAYVLNVDIQNPNPASPHLAARVRAVGGGWK